MTPATDNDFIIVGKCISRPRGWRRVLADFLCRHTGHLLFSSRNTTYSPDNDSSLPFYTSHCRRCWTWGYVGSDRVSMLPGPRKV